MARTKNSSEIEPKKKSIEYVVTDYNLWNRFVDGLIHRDGAYTKFRLTQLLQLRIKTLFLALLGILITILLILYIYNLIFGKSNYYGSTNTKTVVEYIKVPDPNLSEVIEIYVPIEKIVHIPVEVPTKEGVVTNFTIFNIVDTPNVIGVDQVVTGANYNSSGSKFPEYQYCYADLTKKTISLKTRIRIEVAYKNGIHSPARNGMNTAQANEAGLTLNIFNKLYPYCAWLKGSAVKEAEVIPDEIPIDPGNGKGVATGTGFAVNNQGYFVTNEHVVQNCSLIGILFNDKLYPAEIYSKNSNLDLAILKVSSSLTKKHIKFAPEVKTGLSVTALGYPLSFDLGTDIKVTTGIISSMNGYQGNQSNFQFTASIQPGNSGGPLVDQFNRLVGITTAALVGEEFQNVNFAIKSSVLQRFLSKNRIKFKVSNSKKIIDIPTIVDISRDYVRLVTCEKR